MAPGVVIAVSSTETHTMSKPTRDVVRLVEGFGVEDDVHAGATVKHRSRVRKDATQPNLRQVHLIHAELHDELEGSGFAPLEPGQMGENITTRGVDLLALPTGARLRLGEEAVVEVTGLRNPCPRLDGIRPGRRQGRLDGEGRGGLGGRAGGRGVVAAGGEVRAGDAIAVELPPEPHRPLAPV